ncbi:MAG: DNA polymerase III subunit beta [Defluviitaleaceae bacterium]|nr:DNA polymerase III subunit beta [Defluviitaleaceae bacterium]
MRIVCGKSNLVENINIVSKAVGGRATTPILECCLLAADTASGFRLTANDMELAIETKEIEADVLEEGSVALDSRVFFDIVRRLPGTEVEIYSDDKNLTVIKSGKSEFKILGMNSEEFPAVPEVDKKDACTLPATEFKNMIRQTIFSVSQDTSKPVLCGELFEINDGTARMVSVDGFRISLRKYDFDGCEKVVKVIVPGKTLNEISKILPTDEDATISFYTTDKHILFELDNCTVVSRLLDGEFVNYENMFTKGAETFVTVEKAALFESIERAALISRDSKKSPVKLKLEDGQIIITSNTDMGTSYEEISAEQNGPGLEIAFNPRYITDVLKVLECEKVVMEFTTALSPCVIKVEGSEDYRYLVLPLRLRN